MYYALEEAAQLLQVRQNTITKWLRDAGMTPHALDTPVLSDEQLYDLAERHSRTLLSRARGGPFAAINRELQALKAKVERIEAMLGQGGDAHHDGAARDDLSRALERVITSAIAFLGEARHMPAPNQEPIIITSFHGADVFHRVPWLREQWMRALRSALDAGWDILHLYAENPGPARATRIVENLIHLLDASGRYDPAYIKRPQLTSSPWEYIVIPQCGVLKLMLPKTEEQPGCFLVRSGREHGQIVEQLSPLAAHSRKILTRTVPNAVGFSDQLAKAEELDGNRCLIMDGLSEIHVPFSVYEQRQQELLQKARSKKDGAELIRLPRLLEIRQSRDEAFERELEQVRIRDITTRQALLRLVQDGIFSPTDRLRENGPLTKPQRADVLEGLAERLEGNPRHYQLAVLEDATIERLYPRMPRLFWMVKQGHIVLMEMLHDVGERRNVEVDFSISDDSLVAAFYDHFEKTIWNQIPKLEKSRNAIVKWLRQEAHILREGEKGSLARDGRASEP